MKPRATRGQPRFSRDAIAEFQFLASRFDATQGRSTGLQVNAITRSGSNVSSGTFSGYFRDDAFNTTDFIAKKVTGTKRRTRRIRFGSARTSG